jgi:ABC-type lipoprotein release transport system permease subunit
MRMLFSDHYRTARQSLDRARLRTLLTMSGVAIGVASITAIMALSGGVNKVIDKQVSELGNTIAVIRPVANDPTLADLSNPSPSNAYSTSPLVERDIKTIAKLPGTEAVAPLMTLSGSVSIASRRRIPPFWAHNCRLICSVPSNQSAKHFYCMVNPLRSSGCCNARTNQLTTIISTSIMPP